MKKIILCAAMILCAGRTWGLSFPAEWSFGKAGDDKPLSTVIRIKNEDKTARDVRLISPCDCLTLAPAVFRLEPGTEARVTVTFDPAGYSGAVEKPVLVRTKDGENGIFTVRGTVTPSFPLPEYSGECEWCKKQSEENRRAAYESWRTKPWVVRYYYSKSCGSCADFINKEVPRVSALLGRTLEADALDIEVPAYRKEMLEKLAKAGVEYRAIPVLFVGSAVLQGADEIGKRFETEARKIPK